MAGFTNLFYSMTHLSIVLQICIFLMEILKIADTYIYPKSPFDDGTPHFHYICHTTTQWHLTTYHK